MAVVNFSVIIYQGATWSQTITIPGVDLTGKTGKCQIRKQATADSPVLAEPTVVIVGGTDSTVTLSLTAANTRTIPTTAKTLEGFDTYIYDVFAEDITSTEKVAVGTASIYPSVTR